MSPTGDALQIDLAQLLVTTVLLFGLDDALAEAVDRIGAERVATVVPYLQVAALGRGLRAEAKAADLDLDDVRKRAALAAGIEAPTMARLVRASRGTLFRAALLSVAGYVLISQLAGIDFAELADALRRATLSILLNGLLLGQAPRFAMRYPREGPAPGPSPSGRSPCCSSRSRS